MERTNPDSVPATTDQPDFENLLAVLARTTPSRPTLFEFFLNGPLYRRIAGDPPTTDGDLTEYLIAARAYENAGYDFTTVLLPGFRFATGDIHQSSTRSLNEGWLINDRRTFEAYPWPDPEAADYGLLDRLAEEIHPGMKVVIHAPCGVLENVINLVGFERLCLMTVDDEALVSSVFEAVGSRLLAYYERCLPNDVVGAIIGNDDWGFKSQTMLSPDQMRQFVFPWHKRIVQAAHAAGKPAILHSCGCLTEVMDDIIDDMKYDGKHSYEDTIQPVELAYDQYHGRIAIIGGIDLDFVCRSTPAAVHRRSREMLERAGQDGAYALGTGNSVPEYVPDENYFAMVHAALETRRN